MMNDTNSLMQPYPYTSSVAAAAAVANMMSMGGPHSSASSMFMTGTDYSGYYGTSNPLWQSQSSNDVNPYYVGIMAHNPNSSSGTGK